MTRTTEAVLRAMLVKPQEGMYGLQICKQAGLASGTIHPLLARLEHEYRWLESYDEDGDPKLMGRPRRRYYRLTERGVQQARYALASASARRSKAAWTLRPGAAGAK
jgi:DNA-binding PadR family transcriptional regulator